MRISNYLNSLPLRSIIIYSILLAVVCRAPIILRTDFPINDGGFTRAVVEDITSNNYFMPRILSYNHLRIPFAYPPISYYLIALIVNVTSLQINVVLQLLPCVISLLAVAIFPIYATRFPLSRFGVVLASVVFAVSPKGYQWFLMGAGTSRGLGLLLGLLTIVALPRNEHARSYLWAGLCLGLTILTHPEAGLVTSTCLSILWLTRAECLRSFAKLISIGLVAFACILPWLVFVVLHHGFKPFTSAFGARLNDFPRLPFFYTDALFGGGDILFTFLMILGLSILILQKHFFLPLALPVLVALDPRSATVGFLLPLSALACGASTDFPALGIIRNQFVLFFRDALMYFLIILSPLLFLEFTAPSRYPSLPKNIKSFINAIPLTFPPNTRFLILSNFYSVGETEVEWFPVLSERESILTHQGTEWLGTFSERLSINLDLSICCEHRSAGCISDLIKSKGLTADYIYMSEYGCPGLAEQFPKTTLVSKGESSFIFKLQQ